MTLSSVVCNQPYERTSYEFDIMRIKTIIHQMFDIQGHGYLLLALTEVD